MQFRPFAISLGVDVGHRETEGAFLQHTVGVTLEIFRSGPGTDVAIAGRVNEDFRTVGYQAILVGHDDGVNLVIRSHLDGGHTREEKYVGSRLRHHTVIYPDEILGIDGGPVIEVGGFMGDTFLGFKENLLGESTVYDFLPVGEGTPCGHHTGGAEPPEIAGGLDEQHTAPLRRSGDGGGASGGATPRDHDVISVVDGNLPVCKLHPSLPVPAAGGHPVGDGRGGGEKGGSLQETSSAVG